MRIIVPQIDNTGAPCWGVTLSTALHLDNHDQQYIDLIISFKRFFCSTENVSGANKLYSTTMVLVLFILIFSLSLVLPPLRNLCLCHLWHQPAHRHLCQAWQPKPRRCDWLTSIDSFRQLHPDSDLYGGSHIYPLCEGSFSVL